MGLGGVVVDGGEDDVESDEEEDVKSLSDRRRVAEIVRQWPHVISLDKGASEPRVKGVSDPGDNGKVEEESEKDWDAEA